VKEANMVRGEVASSWFVISGPTSRLYGPCLWRSLVKFVKRPN